MNAAQFDVARFASQAAVACVAEAKREVALKDYVQAVKQLPAVFQRHGPGQMLAWLRVQSAGKPRSPYTLLGRQFDAWLSHVGGATEPTALDSITGRDSEYYLQAASLISVFLGALRKQVESGS